MDDKNELKTLVKPESYINFYYNELKKRFGYKNIVLSREGFSGFLLELLGRTQWAIKYYYDVLFRESFPYTATKNTNLRYHANLYNYPLNLATPSEVDGLFVINTDAIPLPSLMVSRREVVLKFTNITINTLPFKLESEYKLTVDKLAPNTWSYQAQITENDRKTIIPFNEYNNNVEIFDCYQYETDEITINTINYVRGSFFKSEILQLNDDEYIYKLITKVKMYDSNEYEEYESSNTKDFYTSDDKVVFYNIDSNGMLSIELGNGIKGKYIPLSSVNVTVYKTRGNYGNFKILENSKIEGKVTIYDYDSNGNSISSDSVSTNIKNIISINLNRTKNGANEDRGEILRANLVKFIQSRSNLVNEYDFYNLLNNYIDNLEILFKKTAFQMNNFFIYTLLTDRINTPTYSLTDTLSYDKFVENELTNSNGDKFVYYPEKAINNKTFISPFLYKYNSLLNVYMG